MNNLDLRSRSRFLRRAALVPTTAVAFLAALAVGGFDSTGPATVADSSSPAIARSSPGSAGATQVVLRMSHGSATATLENTPAARELAARLPVQLTLHDPMGQAKSGRLPFHLPVPDIGRVVDPEVAGLYYWPPSGDIGIFYEDLGQTVPPPGMARLGTVDSGLAAIASAGNRFAISIERV